MFDKIKQLTKDTAIYGVSTIVGRFITFLLVPFYTNIFSPDDYGVIANLYIFIAIFSIIYIFGMDAAYLKFASQKSSAGEKDNFSTPFLTVTIISLFLSLLIIFFKSSLNSILEIPKQYSYLIFYSSLILFIDELCVIPFIKLRIERKAKIFAAYKIINILTNVFFNILLIVYLKKGIEAVLISNVIASVLTLLIFLPDIIKYLRPVINISLLQRLLKFGLPYLPAGLGSMLIQGIDRPILTKLTDLNTVGIYNANHKLGIFMMLVVNMFQYAWQPFFLQQSEEKDAKKIFSKVLTYFTFTASIILVFISIFIDDIVKLNLGGITLIGSAYWSGLAIVPIVLLGYLFNGMYVVFTAGIYIEEKSIYVPLITGIGAAVNIAANFLLIPWFGIIGASLAALASYVVMAFGLYSITQKFYKIEYELGKLFSIFGIIFITSVIFYWLKAEEVLNVFYKSIILILFIVITSMVVFSKNEILTIKNKLYEKFSLQKPKRF
ncbi:MAG: oligosaccharide flippase family protein [Ignavibacteriaceae bacterium]|nr:oligosaccharide flippase family protein [Ignavibacteriaceae bacterium]